MPDSRYRVLLVCSHPVQYASPLFRLMAEHPQLDILVAYCSLQGAERGLDPEFGGEVVWDVPLLHGYPWVQLPNRSPRPGLSRFFGLTNPGLWKLVRQGKFDAVVLYTGYRYASFWIAIAAAKSRGAPVLFGTDANSLQPRSGGAWRMHVKRWLWPRLFRLADVVIVPSEASVEMMVSLGIPEKRVMLTPFVVDNNWWKEQAAHVDGSAVRRHWGLPENALVVLFCAKLQPWKRPQDLLQAFARANVPGAFLVYVGDGPLRGELEAGAEALGVAGRVRFLGFLNQSKLPEVYRAADLLVLPSDYDACPVVICETMLCGCPAVITDRIRGRFDLVKHGSTGFIYPCGDVDALARILAEVLPDRDRLAQIAEAARERMESWSPPDTVEAHVRAVGQALRLRQCTPSCSPAALER